MNDVRERLSIGPGGRVEDRLRRGVASGEGCGKETGRRGNASGGRSAGKGPAGSGGVVGNPLNLPGAAVGVQNW